MDFFSLIVSVAGVGLVVALILAASRRDKFNLVVLVLLPILVTLIALDLIAISTDFHDADGFVDCWPHCSTWQEGVRWTLWVAALLVLALVIAVVLRETLRGLRGKSH